MSGDMVTTSHKEQWTRWLLEERHISIATARQARLSVNDEYLIIPVFDAQSNRLFNKKRRAPWVNTGAKYLYEPGSKASLYGIERVGDVKEILCVESELDSLALRTIGITTVSTTGGSSTWPIEWVPIFADREPIIMYDADKAGIEGAIKVMQKMPHARIAWTPIQYGKDATEVIHNGGEKALRTAIADARYYPYPLKEFRTVLVEERREQIASTNGTPFHQDIAIAFIDGLLRQEKQAKVVHKRKKESDDRIEHARAYPIQNIIKVNRQGLAICPFHGDTKPSLKVYADNHAYCYACGKFVDAISLWRAQNPQATFLQALDALSI